MRINQKQYNIIFNVLMAILMSFFMSLFLTAVNIGLIPGFFLLWLKSFGLGTIVALPTTFVVVPLIHKLLGIVFK
jgi:hypothetical protein